MNEVRVQDLARFRNPPNARGRSAVVVQMWWIVQATLFRASPQFMYGWRRWLLRLFGAKVGAGVLVRPTVRITYPWKVSLDDNCWIGDQAELYSLDAIHIGHDAVVSQHAYLCTGTHDYGVADFPLVTRPVTVEPEAWVAAGVFVHPGVTIAHGSVVAARSVLRGDTRAMTVWSGAPAVEVGLRRIRSKGEI